ncbi:MAG: HEAT repeat domain-containing protein [Cyanobacteria bacterium P01_H01_bin.74]
MQSPESFVENTVSEIKSDFPPETAPDLPLEANSNGKIISPAALQGRDSELRQLVKLLNQAKAGQAKSVLLTGDAGMGKTALIQAFEDSVKQRQQSRVVSVVADHWEKPEHIFSEIMGQVLQEADLLLDDAMASITSITTALNIQWTKADLIRAVSLIQLHDALGTPHQVNGHKQLIKSIRSQLPFTKKLNFSINDTIKKLVDLIVHPWVIVAAGLLSQGNTEVNQAVDAYKYYKSQNQEPENAQSEKYDPDYSLSKKSSETLPALSQVLDKASQDESVGNVDYSSSLGLNESVSGSVLQHHLVAVVRYICLNIHHLDSALLIIIDEWDRIMDKPQAAVLKKFMADWLTLLSAHKDDHFMLVLCARTDGESYTLAGDLYQHFRTKLLLNQLTPKDCKYILKAALYDHQVMVTAPVHQAIYTLSRGNPFWHKKIASCIQERLSSQPLSTIDLPFFEKLGIDTVEGLLEVIFTRLKLHFITTENQLYKVIAVLIKQFHSTAFQTLQAIQEISVAQHVAESYVFEVLRVLYRYDFLVQHAPGKAGTAGDPLYGFQSRFVVEFLNKKTRFIQTDISTDEKLIYLKKIIPLSVKSGELDREKTMEVLSLGKAMGNEEIADYLTQIFIDAFSETKPIVRVNAINNLALIDSKRSRETLYAATSDSSSMVREYAVKNLSGLADKTKEPDDIHKIIQCLLSVSNDDSESVRNEVFNTLFKFRFSHDLTQVFIKGMTDNSHAVRLSSLQSLAESDNQSGFLMNTLLDAALDKHPDIRRYACIGLQRFSTPEAVDCLLNLMKTDPEPGIRSLSADILSGMNNETAFMAMVAMLKHDESEDVKISIVRTLGKKESRQNEAILQEVFQTISHEAMPALSWMLIRSLSYIASTQKTWDLLNALQPTLSNSIVKGSIINALKVIDKRIVSRSNESRTTFSSDFDRSPQNDNLTEPKQSTFLEKKEGLENTSGETPGLPVLAQQATIDIDTNDKLPPEDDDIVLKPAPLVEQDNPSLLPNTAYNTNPGDDLDTAIAETRKPEAHRLEESTGQLNPQSEIGHSLEKTNHSAVQNGWQNDPIEALLSTPIHPTSSSSQDNSPKELAHYSDSPAERDGNPLLDDKLSLKHHAYDSSELSGQQSSGQKWTPNEDRLPVQQAQTETPQSTLKPSSEDSLTGWQDYIFNSQAENPTRSAMSVLQRPTLQTAYYTSQQNQDQENQGNEANKQKNTQALTEQTALQKPYGSQTQLKADTQKTAPASTEPEKNAKKPVEKDSKTHFSLKRPIIQSNDQ